MAIENTFNEPSQPRKNERPEQKAEQLREDIARTRSALSDDVKALGERLNPDQLKEDAKEVIHHAADAARDGAKHIARDARDAAIGSLRHARERAVESITASADRVGERARDAGHAVSDFVATHAIPLTLLGAGAGWLMISMSHQRRLAAQYPSGGYYRDDETMWNRAAELGGRAQSALSRTGQRLGDRAHEIGSDMSGRAAHLRSQVVEGASYVGHEAAELGQRAYHGMERAGTRAIEVSERNPLMVGLLALAAGTAVAMLLPPTRRENQLLGQTRDRLVQGAQHTVEELKTGVQRSVNDVKEVIDEIRQPGSTHA